MIKKDNKFILYIFEIHFDLVQREEKNERAPTKIKKQHTKSIGFKCSI